MKTPTIEKESATNKRSTFVLSMCLNTAVTAILVIVASWFLWTNLQSEARQTVVKDINLVQSKVQLKDQK